MQQIWDIQDVVNTREEEMILGLTGGIASGKSTVSRMFKGYGIEVLDADIIAKRVSKEKDVVEKLITTFGEGILVEGRIDRGRLREVVFSSSENVAKINTIIHPRVIERFEEKKRQVKKEIVVFDIPLLFEAKLEYLCDKVLVVSVDEDTQIKRVMKRDGSSVEVAKRIIGNQMSRKEKEDRGDYVILNNQSIGVLKKKVGSIYEKIKEDNR